MGRITEIRDQELTIKQQARECIHGTSKELQIETMRYNLKDR